MSNGAFAPEGSASHFLLGGKQQVPLGIATGLFVGKQLGVFGGAQFDAGAGERMTVRWVCACGHRGTYRPHRATVPA